MPQPYYNEFEMDTPTRSNARVVGVPYQGIEGYSELDDLFRPDINKNAIEAAFLKAQDDSITISVLLISK